MYQNSINHIGEHASVAEELMTGQPDLVLKCEAITQMVNEGYVRVEEALEQYEVGTLDYLAYLFLYHNEKMQTSDSETQFKYALKSVLTVFAPVGYSPKAAYRDAFTDITKISLGITNAKSSKSTSERKQIRQAKLEKSELKKVTL